MLLKKVLLLCAHSARSSAYVQACIDAQLQPEYIVFYGPQEGGRTSQRDLSVRQLRGLFCPNLSMSAYEAADSAGWNIYHCEDKALDSVALKHLLDRLAPELLIYSGYGGQLVPDSILGRCPVLHVHSGHLPEYRGSTTLYHEVVEHQHCGASAILLESTIDTGPILACQSYPLPPKEMDVDYLYDNLIRADLLVQVLQYRLEFDELPHASKQAQEYPPYFIIHPLLKHIALLAVDELGE